MKEISVYFAIKLWPIISYNRLRYSEPADNILPQELDDVLVFDGGEVSRPDLGPTRMGIRTESGARDYILGLIDLFCIRAELILVGIQTISIITKIIYIYKSTTTGVVSIKMYTHILSPIYLYKHLCIYMSNTNIRDHGSSSDENLSLR